jgi:transcriptional regulator with XRE-family HTH domain
MTDRGAPDGGVMQPSTGGIDGLTLFGENLLRIRQARKLNQEALAESAGIHRTQLSLLEGGRRQPLMETLTKLAGALDVPVSMLTEGIVFVPGPGRGEFQVSPPPELPRFSASRKAP